MTETEFSSGAVALYTEAPFSVLNFYAKAGLVTPSVADTGGPGRPRRWSFKDLILVAVAQQVRLLSVPLEIVRAVLDFLRQWGDLDNPQDDACVAVNAAGEVQLVRYADRDASVEERLQKGVWLQIGIGQLVSDLRSQIEGRDQIKLVRVEAAITLGGVEGDLTHGEASGCQQSGRAAGLLPADRQTDGAEGHPASPEGGLAVAL